MKEKYDFYNNFLEYRDLLRLAKNGQLPRLSKATLEDMGAFYALVAGGYGFDVTQSGHGTSYYGLNSVTNWVQNQVECRVLLATVDVWATKWELYSGDITYPIPCSLAPPDEAIGAFNKYRYDPEHEYGRNTIALAQHLLDCVEKEYDKYLTN